MAQTINNAGCNLTAIPQTVYTVPNSSYSITKIFLSNIDNVNDAEFTVIIRSGQDYTIASNCIIRACETQIIDTPIHLLPNESIVAYSNNNGSLFVSAMEYTDILTITNAKLASIGTTFVQLYQCPTDYKATVRLVVANILNGDIEYSVRVFDTSNSQEYSIASDILLSEKTSEMFDVGINLNPGDVIRVKSNFANSMNVFGSVSLLPLT